MLCIHMKNVEISQNPEEATPVVVQVLISRAPPRVRRDPSYSHEHHMPADHAGYHPLSFPFQNNLAVV